MSVSISLFPCEHTRTQHFLHYQLEQAPATCVSGRTSAVCSGEIQHFHEECHELIHWQILVFASFISHVSF
jgi:hypothetical protein